MKSFGWDIDFFCQFSIEKTIVNINLPYAPLCITTRLKITLTVASFTTELKVQSSSTLLFVENL